MRRTLWTAGLLAVVLVIALVAVGCGGGTTTTTAGPATTSGPATTAGPTTTGGSSTTATSAASTEPIKIGFLVSLTGPSSAPGASIKKGFEFAIAAINTAGGINGRQIQVTTVDDKSDVSASVAGMTQLIEQTGVAAVYGPFPQFCTEAARAVSEKAGVPNLLDGPPTLATLKVTTYKWSFLINTGPDGVGGAYLKMIQNGGYKNIVSVADNLTTSQETSQVVKAGLGSGVAFDLLPDTWGIEAQDVTPIINKLVAEVKKVKPDLIFINCNPIHFPVIAKALRNQGITTQIMAAASCGHPAVFSAGPQVVEGVILPGTTVLGPSALPDSYPGKQKLVDFGAAYQAKYKVPADFFAGYGADAAWILAEGLKAGGDDKAKVRDAIEALQKFTTNSGLASFSPTDHTAYHAGFFEWKIVGGKFTLMSTTPLN